MDLLRYIEMMDAKGLLPKEKTEGEKEMKKSFMLFVVIIFTLALLAAGLIMVDSAYAVKCPEPRKTKTAPPFYLSFDKTKKANKTNGKKLFNKTAKPIACKMCHGKTGAGDGKLGKVLKPHPRNFTCNATMFKISAGQMFWIIKNGSKGTGMVAHKKTLKDKEIWDIIKYIRTDLVKGQK